MFLSKLRRPSPERPAGARRSRARSLALGAAAVALAAVGLACVSHARSSGDGLLPIGAAVPSLHGLDQHGQNRRLADERGQVVLVFFYPKDGTPGCTKEVCAFRDAWQGYAAQGVRVYGVSTDGVGSHSKFAQKQKLPADLVLIADLDESWSTSFGVSSFLGMNARVSFLVGRDGKVAKVYPDVDPAVHAREVLADAKNL